MVRHKNSRWLFLVGGICGILYPILDIGFFALYPLAARGPIVSGRGVEAYMARTAALGERPLVVALEWMHAFLPLLLLPFALALYRLLTGRGQRDLGLLALILLLFNMMLLLPAHGAMPLNHELARSYVEAGTEAERAVIFATFHALGRWQWALGQIAYVLYLAFVGLSSLGLILGRTYRRRGWIGIGGALFGLLKLTPVWPGMTNFLWTGVSGAVWPIAVGIGLLRESRQIQEPAD